jgi:hypothetical protein
MRIVTTSFDYGHTVLRQTNLALKITVSKARLVKYNYVIISLLSISIFAYPQDSATSRSRLDVNSYIKDMGSFSFDKDAKSYVSTNLLHNRLNIKWKPQRSITGSVEVRNRIYWGDLVSSTPDFHRSLKNDNEWLNLSVIWASSNNLVFQSNIERLLIEFRHRKWNMQLGRQRVNWGITTAWNPNDIFNNYNFLDFDYEEKPYTDAVKVQYNFSDSSGIDVAINPYGDIKKSIAAARYSIDKWGYHLQMIAGVYRNKMTAGFGWAGKLGNIEYKGEGQAFIGENDSANRFNYSLEVSYQSKKGWYFSSSILHNSSGFSEPVNNVDKINFRFSPINLMPARWNIIAIISKKFTPDLSSSIRQVYCPRVNLFIVYPSLTYHLFESIDADLIYQSFFLELQNRFQPTSHNIYVRLKLKL